MRSETEQQEIKNLLSEPVSLENFLSDEEINSLIDIFEKTSNESKIFKNTGPITLNIDFTIEPFKSLLNRFAPVLGDFDLISGFYFYTDYPHIIHNDDSFELPTTFKGITLPLRFRGSKKYPYLCFFHQYYLNGPAKFVKGEKELPEFYNKNISDYTEIKNKSIKIFPKIIHDMYLSHLKYEWLDELSFDRALPWKPGNALIFNSVQLHSASNFLKQGITDKLGISIFTKKL
jgi:hypothetical protein